MLRRYHLAPISLIVALSFLAAFPVLRFGLPFGYDAAEHLAWYRCFVEQLQAGEWYPRWLLGMNGGLGSPDLFVYGPLPYYAAAVFHPFTGPGREVYDLGLSIVVALILAGLGAYLWLRKMVGGTLVPTLGAVIYMAVPYYLKTDLYARVALAEFWTFAWMPLILYFTIVLSERRTLRAQAGLALSWGLLFITHLFTAMLFAPVFLLYAGWLARPGERTRVLSAAVAGMLLGFALGAFYLLPALSYEKYIPAYKLIETRPDYRYERNFLFSNVAPTQYLNSISRYTAWTAVVAALFGAAAFMGGSVRLRREALWWLVVAAGTLLMMLPVSIWFWAHLPLLSAIQFPSRLNTLMTIATAGVAAAGLESLRARFEWRKAAVVSLGLLLIAGWLPSLVQMMKYQHGQIRDIGSLNLDYLITAWAQWTDPKLVTTRGIPTDASTDKLAPESGTAVVRSWKPRLIEFHTESPSENWVTVKQFYLPTWTASLAQGSPLALRPSPREGLIAVQVPAGAADVRLRIPAGMSEIAGEVVSGLTAMALLWMTWWRRDSTDPHSTEPRASASGVF